MGGRKITNLPPETPFLSKKDDIMPMQTPIINNVKQIIPDAYK
jgi:hypothetical protein